jgi:hypothetical protein
MTASTGFHHLSTTILTNVTNFDHLLTTLAQTLVLVLRVAECPAAAAAAAGGDDLSSTPAYGFDHYF